MKVKGRTRLVYLPKWLVSEARRWVAEWKRLESLLLELSQVNADVLRLLGGLRVQRAYYWCPSCGQGDAPLDRRLDIVKTAFSAWVREAVTRLGAEVPFERGHQLLRDLTEVAVSKRKHEEISETAGAALQS